MNLARTPLGRSRRVLGSQAVVAAVVGSLMLAAPIVANADDPPSPPPSPKTASQSTGEQPSVAGVNCSDGNHCLFYTDVNSSKKQYFDSVDHFNGDTFSGGDGWGAGQPVNNNSWAASNSSTGNRESHWYDGQFHTGFLFCVNPGRTLHSMPANFQDRVSSLRLRPRTPTPCLEN